MVNIMCLRWFRKDIESKVVLESKVVQVRRMG